MKNTVVVTSVVSIITVCLLNNNKILLIFIMLGYDHIWLVVFLIIQSKSPTDLPHLILVLRLVKYPLSLSVSYIIYNIIDPPTYHF